MKVVRFARKGSFARSREIPPHRQGGVRASLEGCRLRADIERRFESLSLIVRSPSARWQG